jgi:MOSC domain-containing protein YiiM
MIQVRVDHVLTGRSVPFGPNGESSGIDKQCADGPVRLMPDGLAGDAQGDTRHHGGPEKAVHHYPRDHYPVWRAEYPQLVPRLSAPGAFGENISTEGASEADVCVGDVLRLGTALVQVSQGRQPCWRLNVRFEASKMARWVQQSGRTGWYYRVLEPGEVAAGDFLRLSERPCPEWPLSRIVDVLYRDTLNREALAAMSALPELAESWRTLAARRLERHAVEDWSHRVSTPER